MDKQITSLSNLPPKGTSDWFGDEFLIRKYIFDTWREVCQNYGYEEYLTPLFEDARIYRAKSGEDVGDKELTTFISKSGKEYAIRPEMTPSVTRLVSRIYEARSKPIRLFSIANFVRNEKPQKGRNREFWQLNYDIFGADGINADVETLMMAIDIMKKFDPPKDSFKIFLNHRKLIDFILDNVARIDKHKKVKIIRLMDKWKKLSLEEFKEKLNKINLAVEQIDVIINYIISDNRNDLLKKIPQVEENQGFKELNEILTKLEMLGYGEWIAYKSDIIRGFDYYDGMVFEVFDQNKNNPRSLFGGGRYNGLAQIFGGSSFPAVGCAPGDETTKIFLQNWNLVPRLLDKIKDQVYYMPLITKEKEIEVMKLAQKIRSNKINLILGLELRNISKALDYASKNRIDRVILYGDDEINQKKYIIKDLKTGKQEEFSIE
ncbi:MAG: histidine--tRNA ligase [Candidatus Moranbacteria bacterium]|nr:histidine--tRNA ligase [Candidatus Moranbacteria bacterium]